MYSSEPSAAEIKYLLVVSDAHPLSRKHNRIKKYIIEFFRAPPALHSQFPPCPLGQGVGQPQFGPNSRQAQGLTVPPLHAPAGDPLLGAQVQKTLREQPPDSKRRCPPHIIHRPSHTGSPRSAESR